MNISTSTTAAAVLFAAATVIERSTTYRDVMHFLFDDRAADYENLRAAGYTVTGGAETGDVLTVASMIDDSSSDAWWSAWNSMAGRIRYHSGG